MKIFLSSTSYDLKHHRDVVIYMLELAGEQVICMEKLGATDAWPLDVCKRWMEESDIYVGLSP